MAQAPILKGSSAHIVADAGGHWPAQGVPLCLAPQQVDLQHLRLGFWVLGFRFRLLGIGFWVSDFGSQFFRFRISDSGLQVSDSGFQVSDSGFTLAPNILISSIGED